MPHGLPEMKDGLAWETCSGRGEILEDDAGAVSAASRLEGTPPSGARRHAGAWIASSASETRELLPGGAKRRGGGAERSEAEGTW